jgi:uncharacterized protein YyaL (SSP411 family)
MSNRLAGETSPYLRQHKDNPVDWWPWSPGALAEAQRRGVPVLLSVGYSACHWCHVMAHESFEDVATAALMNEHFVNIKVDREERPDIDAIYMEATQAMTGHGGWPMTVFMTPKGEPFFCGTYYPPTPRHGMPSFSNVLTGVAQAWETRRDELAAIASDIVARLDQRATRGEGGVLDEAALDAGAQSLRSSYDESRGGFGGAPKFPPSMVLEFLLRHSARLRAPGTTNSASADYSLEMAVNTCERMARGGMYDQLAGGFARYSVDADWVVPHFEKMLYDNSLLARVYAHLWRSTGDEMARRIAIETCEFIVRDLGTAEGGFASALDADSEGVEGKYYVWTPAQLVDVLGAEDGAWAARAFEVTEGGTFEDGASVLQLLEDPEDGERFARVRAALLDARRRRIAPGRDDKVVTAWNGLAIAALAEAGALFDRGDFVDAATAAAELLIDLHRVSHRVRRASLAGVVGVPAGVLEDYGDLAEGLLALYWATGRSEWLEVVGELLAVVLHHFADGSGGFYDTADDAEALVRRPQDPTDNATPSGSSAAAGALLSYAGLTGSQVHRVAAEEALGVVAALVPAYARFAGWAVAVGEALLAGPVEVAVVGPADAAGTKELVRTARMSTSPGLVLATPQDGKTDGFHVPLLDGREMRDGLPTAYACRQFVCSAPVTSAAELAAQLSQ